MLKKINFSVFVSLSTTVFSQTQIKVLDAENKTNVPYAKIILKGKDYYKNTEQNGDVTLEKDEEIDHIESFGYENYSVSKKIIFIFSNQNSKI
jgi:hypothetical protein